MTREHKTATKDSGCWRENRTTSLPDISVLRALLDYNPETGRLFWKEGEPSLFAREQDWKTWLGRHAGCEAMATYDREGYRTGVLRRMRLKAHRVAWAIYYGEWPSDHIDHINGDRADNRISNLRNVTKAENSRNAARRCNNTSGVVGVRFLLDRRCWNAYISVDKRQRHIGDYLTKEEAILARKRAEREFGYHPNHGREAA